MRSGKHSIMVSNGVAAHVHFVDETLDGGPIIAQRIVPVRDDDDEVALSARILAEEHQLVR